MLSDVQPACACSIWHGKERSKLGQPTFAVVIPVRNKERHAARSLLSAQEQALPADEIIVINDASSDRSMQQIHTVANDRVVSFRRNEPGPGGYAARNLGIENAKSEWIAFLDADDSWTPDHLSSIRAAIERAGDSVGCVFTGYEFIEPTGRRVPDWFSKSGHAAGIFTPTAMLDIWLEGGCPIWTGAVAIRRDVLMAVGMFPAGLCRRGGDRDLWLRTMLHTDCAYTGSVTARYHRDADNMLTNVESFAVRQRILDSIVELLPATRPDLTRQLRRIANREMRQYALKAWKSGASLRDSMWSDYDARIDPAGYALIRMLTVTPFPMSQSLRGRIRQTKAHMLGCKRTVVTQR